MTNRLLLAAIAALITMPAPARAQEAIALTVAKTTPNVTSYAPKSILIDATAPLIVVTVIASGTGQIEDFRYPCTTTPGAETTCTSADTPAEVSTLITGLNTANLTIRSLWRRVFDRLCSDFPARFPGGCTVP